MLKNCPNFKIVRGFFTLDHFRVNIFWFFKKTIWFSRKNSTKWPLVTYFEKSITNELLAVKFGTNLSQKLWIFWVKAYFTTFRKNNQYAYLNFTTFKSLYWTTQSAHIEWTKILIFSDIKEYIQIKTVAD